MWITESAKKGKKLKDMYSVSGIDVYIKDGLSEEIDPDFVFKYIKIKCQTKKTLRRIRETCVNYDIYKH